jgi:MFS family permease
MWIFSFPSWSLQLTQHFLQGRKIWVVAIGMMVVINSTMGSSLPSNAIPIISKYFHITSSYAEILPISMYLVGYVLGPLLFGPLSETYGRKVIMLSTFGGFTVFTMACALAPNFPALLIFRLLTGINASSPIAVVGGIYADIHNDPVTRGRSMSVFMGVSKLTISISIVFNTIRQHALVLSSPHLSQASLVQLLVGGGSFGSG